MYSNKMRTTFLETVHAFSFTLPCDLSHDAFDITYPYTTCAETDGNENFPFLQLRLQAVIKAKYQKYEVFKTMEE